MDKSNKNAMVRKIRFGPAGWLYKDWEGIVYPRPKPRKFDPLAYLSHYFDTIEVDSTFYHPATPKTAESWVSRVASNPNFRFTAKLWKRFTHERDKSWTAAELEDTRAGFEVLAAKRLLGAVLLQFPWSFKLNERNLEWLRDLLAAFGDFPLVLEVRHESWNSPDVYDELTEKHVGIVNIDQPLFHNSIRPSARATSGLGYVRVHGRNYVDWFRKEANSAQRYNYLYTAKELSDWSQKTRELAANPLVEELYVVTNNHYLGKAPANALMLKSLVTGEIADSPPELFAKYESVMKDFSKPVPAQTSDMLQF